MGRETAVYTSSNKHEMTWIWLGKRNLKKETESFDNSKNTAIWTNNIEAKIDNTQQNIKCRLCEEKDEIINHIVSECSKLT